MLATQRSRSALDGATTPIISIDEKLVVIYANEAMKKFLARFEAEIRRDAPRFSLDTMVGSSIDVCYKHPEQQRRLLDGLKQPSKTRIGLGGRLIDQVVVVARDDAGKTIGYSIEWLDQTEQVVAQNEVEALLKGAVEGDLTGRLDAARYEGFVKQIAEGMNRLLDSISDSFRQVKTAVEQIGEAATQLRTTSQMMSSSAVQLNRAADDSSSSLGKTAEMVRANAENAAMANQLVTPTSSAAQDGQARMQDMSQAMAAINASAQQIAKIIKVIDEMAFQTNLLALNAAVEKVSQGVKIADNTRGALEEIIGNVAKVVDLAGEIDDEDGALEFFLALCRTQLPPLWAQLDAAERGQPDHTQLAKLLAELSQPALRLGQFELVDCFSTLEQLARSGSAARDELAFKRAELASMLIAIEQHQRVLDPQCDFGIGALFASSRPEPSAGLIASAAPINDSAPVALPAHAAAAAVEAKPGARKRSSAPPPKADSGTEFLRIDARKLSLIMDLTGELARACGAVTHHPELEGMELEGFAAATHKLEMLIGELQNEVSAMRLVPGGRSCLATPPTGRPPFACATA